MVLGWSLVMLAAAAVGMRAGEGVLAVMAVAEGVVGTVAREGSAVVAVV